MRDGKLHIYLNQRPPTARDKVLSRTSSIVGCRLPTWSQPRKHDWWGHVDRLVLGNELVIGVLAGAGLIEAARVA